MRTLAAILLLGMAPGLWAQQQTFTSNGTFVVPPGVTTIDVELVGAGGDGESNGGGGGGGGAYASGSFAVVPGTTYSVVVGAGGSELATIIGGLGILAGAGANGTIVANPNIGGGGVGGQAQGGQVNRSGGAGGGGYWTYFGGGGGGAAGSSGNGTIGGNTVAYNGNCLTPGGAAGMGGGSPGGSGGKGSGFIDNACTVTDPAGNGAAYGGGGGGGNGIGSPVGVGGSGLCIISWNTSTAIADGYAANVPAIIAPFTDRIRFTHVDGTEHYTLVDLTGRVLWAGRHLAEQDLSHLPDGAYVVRMEAQGSVRTYRTVKQGVR